MRTDKEIKAVRMPEPINYGKAKGWYGSHDLWILAQLRVWTAMYRAKILACRFVKQFQGPERALLIPATRMLHQVLLQSSICFHLTDTAPDIMLPTVERKSYFLASWIPPSPSDARQHVFRGNDRLHVHCRKQDPVVSECSHSAFGWHDCVKLEAGEAKRW